MNPYEVLGVSESASDEEIKRAYRELVRKYHPDQYQNNPLSELAGEKLKEVNEAYDVITRQRASGASSRHGGGRSRPDFNDVGSHSAGDDERFGRIRELINAGNVDAADRLLEILPHTAEWYFLKGNVCLRRGWAAQAGQYLQEAIRLDPNNFEYQQAYQQFQQVGRGYRQHGYQAYGGGDAGNDLCTLCQCLMCTNCCCDCLNGPC